MCIFVHHIGIYSIEKYYSVQLTKYKHLSFKFRKEVLNY